MVAVILLVAVTVTLSAVIGGFALNLGQSTTDSSPAKAGVSVSDQPGAVTVTYTTNSGVDKLVIENSTSTRNLSSVGDSVTMDTSVGEEVTIYAVEDSSRTVLTTHTYDGPSTTTTTLLVGDDFEDGDTTIGTSGWSGWASTNGDGTFNAQTTTVLSGSYSGRFTLNSGTGSVRYIEHSEELQPTKFSTLVQIENGPDSGESTSLGLRNGSNGFAFTAAFFPNGTIQTHEGETIGAWNVGSMYKTTVSLDWSTQTVDYTVKNVSNGSIAGQTKDVPFRNSVSGITCVRFGIDYDGGDKEVVLWDDVELKKTE